MPQLTLPHNYHTLQSALLHTALFSSFAPFSVFHQNMLLTAAYAAPLNARTERTITAPHGSSVFAQTWQPRRQFYDTSPDKTDCLKILGRQPCRQYYDTSPVTGSTFSALSSSSPISSSVRWPASARIFRSISSANAGLSRRTCLAFSRPCPSLSPL